LLESAQIGWNAVGVDLNPLAVMIANAKVDLFRLGLKKFQESIQPVRDKVEALLGSVGSWDDPVEATFRSRLKTVGSCQSIGGLDYLEKWFPRDVLLQLRAILVLIGKVRDRTAKSALKACLSNILRGVSLQEPADLRIRRRKDPRDNYPAMLLFRDEVNRLLGSLRNTACLMNLVPQGTRQIALHRDSRLVHAIPDASKHLPTSDSLFDAAITSPPYANALPYIDTQRLSLVFLGLAKSNEIVGIDRTLTGSREITKSTRDSLELALERNEGELPSSVCGFLTDLLKKAVRPGIGFRRRNCPALLYRYFTDMKNVFAAIHGRLKKGAAFALVVGNNRTRLSGTEIVIPTPQLLSQVAASVGFVEECIEQLDTYHRYELHQANSINSESLLVLRLR
jgi:site-specific DNA-methyltransferase (cytosine-N4-specific)